MMHKFINAIIQDWGYRNTSHFVDSTFHPDFAIQAAAVSGGLAFIAHYFRLTFGIELPVGIVIIILFAIELKTGVMASKKEGEGWSTDKFQKGWLKFAVYWILIGCLNVLDIYLPSPKAFGFSFDMYAVMYFAWLNFVLVNLLGSNIENFIRLGWDKNSLLVRLLAKLYNIKKKEDENKPD